MKYSYHEIRKKLFDPIRTCGCVLFGNALLGFTVAAFVIPHDLIMGGTTGIGILLSNAFSIDPAVFVLVLNLVLLFLGLFILGKKFFITTVASSVLYPAFLALAQRIPGIESFTEDPLLAAIFAGALLGIAIGLVMRVGSSTGGTDIVSLVLHKWFHLPISVLVYLVDILVIGGQAIFAAPEQTLFALLLLLVEAFALEQVMVLGKAQIQIFVVSEFYEELRHKLLIELEAGLTMAMIETGALAKEQKAILCVIPTRKLHDATKMICATDPNAFITITKIKEVRGRGFTLERKAESLKKISEQLDSSK